MPRATGDGRERIALSLVPDTSARAGFGVMIKSWKQRSEDAKNDAAGDDKVRREYVDANASFVAEAINGRAAFSDPDPSSGAHMVANIASVHIPRFVQASLAGDPKPYKNGYDLKRYRVGEVEPQGFTSRRETVDASLPLKAGAKPSDVYFMAVELNGTGVRFYGDVSLLLRHSSVGRPTTILDRNSFELTRDPLAKRIQDGSGSEHENRCKEARALAGTWHEDLEFIATIKVFGQLGGGARQWTQGQISDAVLVDEDYVEVLRIGSFSTKDLQVARIAAEDAAHESLIADRCRQGPSPSFESMLWRYQRRNADEALRAAGVTVHVIVTSGRTRS